jgi:hypothetical protein
MDSWQNIGNLTVTVVPSPTLLFGEALYHRPQPSLLKRKPSHDAKMRANRPTFQFFQISGDPGVIL